MCIDKLTIKNKIIVSFCKKTNIQSSSDKIFSVESDRLKSYLFVVFNDRRKGK